MEKTHKEFDMTGAHYEILRRLSLSDTLPQVSDLRDLLRQVWGSAIFFFLLYAAWVRSRAERPSVSYTKVVMEVAWTGHNLQYTKTN